MVILSFDIEEFDLPTEYGIELPDDRQIAISEEGLNNLLDLLEEEEVPATFYCTVRFIKNVTSTTRRRLSENHKYEIASHGMHHGKLSVSDLAASRSALQELTGKEVTGFRMPRMMPVDPGELIRAGYRYDSSLNPTFIPGRYNHLSLPSVPFLEQTGLVRLPGPVTPTLRIPLFWLGLHHYPLLLYKWLCCNTHRRTGYLQLYFHPWEFVDWTKERELGALPYLVTHRAGWQMTERLRSVVRHLKKEGAEFATAGPVALQFQRK